jgi:integrase
MGSNVEHTLQNCPACGGDHSLAECLVCRERSLLGSEDRLAELCYADAFAIWFKARLEGASNETSVRYISLSSEATYKGYEKAVSKFLGDIPLNKVTDGHIRVFQDARSQNRNGLWKRKAGRNRIRKETDTLIRVMKAAGVWTDDLKKHFSRLPREFSEIVRAIEPHEQNRLLRIMISRPEWEWVYHYSVVALATSMSTFEIRGIRLCDIDQPRAIISVPPAASKNSARNRTIPLEPYALTSIDFLRNRARRYGAFSSRHYLFPYGIGAGHFPDPEKPMTKDGIMGLWEKIRIEAGLPKLRPYDLRHMALTRMAEADFPMHVMLAMAGHLSLKQQQHYIAVSMQTKRKFAQQLPLLDVPKKPPLRFVPEHPNKKTA